MCIADSDYRAQRKHHTVGHDFHVSACQQCHPVVAAAADRLIAQRTAGRVSHRRSQALDRFDSSVCCHGRQKIQNSFSSAHYTGFWMQLHLLL